MMGGFEVMPTVVDVAATKKLSAIRSKHGQCTAGGGYPDRDDSVEDESYR